MKHTPKYAAAAVAVVAAVAVGATAVAGPSEDTATCTPNPVVDRTAGGSEFSVTCSVPNSSVTETATATATVTKTVTASPDPQPTSSTPPSSPPAETPTTPPSSSPPAGDFPDADSTGWRHTGVALRRVGAGDSGPGWSVSRVGDSDVFYVLKAGTVIDGLDIPFCVKVMANDVTIKRSRISCASYYAVNVSDPPTYFSGLTMTDVELDGKGSLQIPGIAVMASPRATYTRLDVHGFGSSGPRLTTGSKLVDSYIHGFVCASGWHSAGTSANDGGSGIVISGNNIDISTGKDGCASAAAAIYPDFGSYNGVEISGNRFAGGAYCLYTAQNTGKASNVHVVGNTFARTYYPRCGQYGAAAQVASGNGSTFSGNVYDDGTPVD